MVRCRTSATDLTTIMLSDYSRRSNFTVPIFKHPPNANDTVISELTGVVKDEHA